MAKRRLMTAARTGNVAGDEGVTSDQGRTLNATGSPARDDGRLMWAASESQPDRPRSIRIRARGPTLAARARIPDYRFRGAAETPAAGRPMPNPRK
jgi:hypothetical protein